VTGPDDPGAVPRRQAPPCRQVWPAGDDERLLLVVMGQHYLLYEDGPRPLTYTDRRAAHLFEPTAAGASAGSSTKVSAVRRRLHDAASRTRWLTTRRRHPLGQQPCCTTSSRVWSSHNAGPPDLELMDEDPDDRKPVRVRETPVESADPDERPRPPARSALACRTFCEVKDMETALPNAGGKS